MKIKESKEIKREKITKWPKAAIIILNWNGWKDTIECLESVFRSTYSNYQVIVIDGGSTDSSMEKIKDWANGKQINLIPESTYPLYHLSHPPIKKPIPFVFYNREEAEKGGDFKKEDKIISNWKNKNDKLFPQCPLILIKTSKNLGYAGGNNVGMRYVLKKNNYKYVWILNNDIVIEEDTLTEIVKLAENNKKIGILGPKIYFYDKPEILHSCGAKMNLWTGRGKFIIYEENKIINNKINEIDWVPGAAIMLKIEVLKRIGLFFEKYFLTYEETDLCCKAKRSGFKIIAVPFTKIWHKGASSKVNPITEYYLTRNRLIFMKRNINFVQRFSFLCFYFIGTLKRFLLFMINGENESAKALLKGVFSGFSEW